LFSGGSNGGFGIVGRVSTLPRRLSVATAIATVLICVPVLPAGASRPDPANRLHEAKATAAADKQRLDQARAQVAAAQTRLTDLAATAQKAVDRYTAAVARLRKAQAVVQAARVALAAAAAEADAQQRQFNRFVRAAYMSGGPLTSVAVVLNGKGPSAILDRAALLGVVSQSQSDLLAQLVQARQRESAAADVAAAATAKVERGVARADGFRRTALMAMANQHALVAKLTIDQNSLAKTLAQHESQVAHLAQERRATRVRAKLAAQRAILAASWSQLEAAGQAMPLATRAQGRQVVKWAKRQLGIPYSWAAGDMHGPTLGAVNKEGNPAGLHTVGFDCSGLTLFAWAHVGFRLDHYTGYQWLEGHHIPLEKIRPGDLVFFARNTANPMSIHHVGIYVGHGRMIDAPHTGAKVRYDDVFVQGLIGAVRP
jgi:cell wall-associated NlpC family hydrolase